MSQNTKEKIIRILQYLLENENGVRQTEFLGKFEIDGAWCANNLRIENFITFQWDEGKHDQVIRITSAGISFLSSQTKPGHEKIVGKILLILFSAIAGVILAKFWDYLAQLL